MAAAAGGRCHPGCRPRLEGLGPSVFSAPRLAAAIAVFWLTYVENTGAAFGVGPARNGFFIGLSSLLIAGLIYLVRYWRDKNAFVQAGLLLVLGGAIGNLCDRLAYGFVVDFLDFRVWPVFNIADSCISVGAGCLGLGLWQDDKAAAATSG